MSKTFRKENPRKDSKVKNIRKANIDDLRKKKNKQKKLIEIIDEERIPVGPGAMEWIPDDLIREINIDERKIIKEAPECLNYPLTPGESHYTI